jgi:hypothetical protein
LKLPPLPLSVPEPLTVIGTPAQDVDMVSDWEGIVRVPPDTEPVTTKQLLNFVNVRVDPDAEIVIE